MITLQGLILALSTAVLFAIYGLLSRVLAVKTESPLAFSVVYGLFGSVLSIPFILVEPWKFGEMTSVIIFVTFLATLSFGVFEATQFFARKYLEASRSTIIFQITPVVTFLGSLLFLRESVSIQKTIAIGVIVLGNIIALYKHGGQVTPRRLLFAVITVVALGLGYVADKAVFSNYPLGLYMVISYFFPALYVFFLFLSRGGSSAHLRNELIRASWRLPVLAFVSVLGYFMVLKTFQITEASVAIPIVFTSTILTALGGIIILKERGNIMQKLLGAIFVFGGVVLLS